MDVTVKPLIVDSEVSEIKDMIVVGSPAVNSLARELLGIDK